ncbi:MAG: Bifunctional purine biosynthesis protein PurH [Bacteroidetes bacterium ADurb.Bin408]|nr:MAG: Bifunctional purine biosynthesis protein PurH [Bacteroidetes bacterium ADurb.Bin408]
MKKIRSALVSVYHKEGLDALLQELHKNGVVFYSTGGTYDYITSLGLPAVKVEILTSYPSILNGRVKTLHPKVFGGILARRDVASDGMELTQYGIPEIDLVIVDLYPFEQTLAAGATHEDIIEKIDIGGISLIRAAAKNYNDVVIIPSSAYYNSFLDLLVAQKAATTTEQRQYFAAAAFAVSSHYDTAIFHYMNRQAGIPALRISSDHRNILRYGENPHQKGSFYGNQDEVFEKLNGKEISYNNLLDLDAALALINDFEETTFAIIKHNNACGIASRPTLSEAWDAALAGDPVSAYGGILVTNTIIDEETAKKINTLFFEIIAAPDYEKNSFEILKQKKNRVILKVKTTQFAPYTYRSALNGVLEQDRDNSTETKASLIPATTTIPTEAETEDLLFANKVVKHTKSNCIVLVKGKQLLASGTGQTSRVDALKQAIVKAKEFGFDLKGAVMASDAFFPFPDCVELAHREGITAVIQPGGSIHDKLSVDYCNKNSVAMVFTGIRHFKH